jgi:hypothetical protein
LQEITTCCFGALFLYGYALPPRQGASGCRFLFSAVSSLTQWHFIVIAAFIPALPIAIIGFRPGISSDTGGMKRWSIF